MEKTACVCINIRLILKMHTFSLDIFTMIDWNSIWCMFILLFSAANVVLDIPTFFSRWFSQQRWISTGNTGREGGRSWQMVAIEVTCKVHYGARQVYTALLLKSENVYRLTLSLLVCAVEYISSSADCPSIQIRKWNSVSRRSFRLMYRSIFRR